MDSKKVFIIAEAGVNHNGSIELAKKLVDAAIVANVDAVKFQTYHAESVISRYATKAKYQMAVTDQSESQLEMAQKLELSFDEHVELINYCKQKKIQFLSSPFDLESIDTLDKLGLDTIKVPSGEIVNILYLRKLGKMNKQVILSTGMSVLGEIEEAIQILEKEGTSREKITLLHCNTEYPTPYKDANLNAMLTLKNAFKLRVGYSDHTLGNEIAAAAVAMGATIIEKHFTLDKNMKGPDHQASLEPHELKELVNVIRHVEIAMGNGIKQPSPSELKNMVIARKSIVAKTPINKGDVFSEDNITIKRPGSGIPAMKWDSVIGKKASRDFMEDELIEL